MTNLEMTLEEAIENRDALWVLYMMAEREKVAQVMYYQHVTSGFKWENEGQWFRDKYLGYADQILKERVKWLNVSGA
ncbi:hypothetical protein LCGC14_2207180 [marine sediment metagenome]|uniref:Uncharacterized protein n=1 Tax=marine sediment metagenome TaxID=412755 RepID=A0A0F9DF65_9ZZZZ